MRGGVRAWFGIDLGCCSLGSFGIRISTGLAWAFGRWRSGVGTLLAFGAGAGASG